MGILLGFTPFILFTLLTSISVSLALWIAFAAAFAISIRDFLHAKMVRVLDASCLLLFALLAIYAGFIQPSLTVKAVRFIADAAMLLIALGTMLLRNPFTLEYARDLVPSEEWPRPRFVRLNYFLTFFWALSFAVMGAADGLAAYTKIFPFYLEILLGLATLTFAIVVTVRLPLALTPRRR